MGLLRVYLALCVVAAHSGFVLPWAMHSGKEAVQIFYIISGFYMALVLSSRYNNPRDFYISRLLRIFPPYFVVLAGTLVICGLSGAIFHRWIILSPYATQPLNKNGALGFLLAAASNLTIVGQDWLFFLKQDSGKNLVFTENFWIDPHPFWPYLLVGQSWSIAIELSFYACAPYLNRLRTRWLGLIAVVMLALRVFCYLYLGLAHDPWDYRFFPFEISLFIMGMIGYRLYAFMLPHFQAKRYRCLSMASCLISAPLLLLLLYLSVRTVNHLGRAVGQDLAMLITYPFWALGIPVLFFIFGGSKIDRMVGEMSYPVYLVHLIVAAFVIRVFSRLGLSHWEGVASAIISIVIACVFYRSFIASIDYKRHRLAGLSAERT